MMVSNIATTAQKPITGKHSGALCSEPDMEAFQRLLSGYEKARKEGFAPINLALEELLSASKSKNVFKDQNIHVPGLTDSQEDVHTQEIVPEPFYFVKLRDMEGHKVFINMCGCFEIAAPGEWQHGVPLELEESFSLMESNIDYGTQNLRFSLSCTDYIFSTDKHYKIPRGKYKGDFVRKHHIRALKAQLVTEIPDADQPSFPLLSIKSSQTLDSQVDLLNPMTFDKSSDLSEPSLGTQESLRNSSPLGLLDEKSAMSLQHKKTPESFSSFQEALDTNKRTQEYEVHGEIRPDVNFASSERLWEKDSKTYDEHNFCGVSSSIVSEQNKEPYKLGDGIPSQDKEVHSMELSSKQTPLIQAKFLGCPLELLILCITFPSPVEVQVVKVWVSKTELYLEAGSFGPITVSLIFPTNPTKSKASFFQLERILEVYLPYLPYIELLE